MLEKNTVILDRYRILDVAGKGGMGRVYHAVDVSDGSHWAIKEDLSPGMELQLYEEADVLAGLSHPALPKTRGVQSWQGQQYMIMQFMEGVTLSKKLKTQERFPERQVLDWFLQICDVLRYLHSRPHPVVYRDLKPSNVIVDQQDRVKIIDFGIAEEYSHAADGERMHKSGMTRGYAAPEQYDRRFKADVRTDIYNLGVTIHYLLTGKNPMKPPFEFLPVTRLCPDISPAMEQIVQKCLQPNPDLRYSTAGELYQALLHIDEENRALRKKRQKRLMGFGLLAAAAVVAVLVAGSWIKVGRQQQIQAYYTLVEQAREAADGGEYMDARTLAQEAIDREPREMAGYLAMGYSYLQQGQYDACLQYISAEVLDRFPDSYGNEAFLELMAQLYGSRGMWKEALYYYQERCKVDAGKPEGWLDLAQCHIHLGNVSDARQSLERYLEAGGDRQLYRQLLDKLPK